MKDYHINILGSSSWRVGANSLRNVGLSTETGLF